MRYPIISSAVPILVLLAVFAPPSACQVCFWNPTGTPAVQATIKSLHVADLGAGARLYAGGNFYGGLAAYNGASWIFFNPGLATYPATLPCGSPWLPSCPPPLEVRALATMPGPTGPELVAGGVFDLAGGSPAAGIARFDGTAWSPMGAPPGTVLSLCVYDNGQGPRLYAGVTSAGNTGVFVWNGTASWSLVGGGLSMPLGTGQVAVRRMAVFDDGTGPKLVAAGTFTAAGGVSALRVAAWDGIAWAPLGMGIGLSNANFTDTVRTLAVYDDGTGPALYAAGEFLLADGQPANRVARFAASSWSAAGSGIGTVSGMVSYGTVSDLAVFDDGTGPRLYASGLHSPQTEERVFRFDGQSWNPVPGAPTITPNALAVFTDIVGPALFTDTALSGFGPVSRLGCQSGLSLQMSQPLGPGTPVWVSNANLTPGREYFNIFSVDPCPGGPGTGPLLGLCSNDISFQVQQLLLPLGQPPFHFAAHSSAPILGSYMVGPMTVDGVCLDLTGGVLGLVSPAIRFAIQ